MRYKVRVVDTVVEEFHYIVEADSEEAAREEAEELHTSNPNDADEYSVVERDVEVEE